jgi:hypothetical protein
MMNSMRRLAPAAVFLFAALAPLVGWADDQTGVDGRLEGYRNPVTYNGGGTALLWMLLFVLAVVTLIGLFKTANRSHLD